MEINKNLALAYVRSDIEILAEQWEENEIRAYINRIRGQVGLLLAAEIIFIEEASALEDEMGKSRKTAASNLQKTLSDVQADPPSAVGLAISLACNLEKPTMKNLKLEEVQNYFDHETNEPLQIWLGKHHMEVDDLSVELEGVPLLINERTKELHLPDKTKYIIKHFIKEAKSRSEAGVSLYPKALGSKRYSYASSFNFIYSQIDYEYIPGLVRPWNEGFLTPVFFNLSCLNKYSQHPDYELDLFSESYGSLRRGDEWGIEFGINENNKLIMWLGDIDGLPDNEKYYLRSENIESDHNIHSEFYDAQIGLKWSSPSKQSALFHCRRELKELIYKKIKLDLYMLDGEVSKVIENLHRPIFWEDKHVGPVIESFNRVFVESLNISKVKADVLEVTPAVDLKGKGSLKVFESWLQNRLELESYTEIMCPFYVLYDFRVITCHLQSEESRSEKLTSINKRLGIPEDNLSNEIIYDSLIDLLSKSYSAIIHAASQIG